MNDYSSVYDWLMPSAASFGSYSMAPGLQQAPFSSSMTAPLYQAQSPILNAMPSINSGAANAASTAGAGAGLAGLFAGVPALGVAGLVLQGVSALLGHRAQKKAKKEAEEAAKKQAIKDAWTNLISAAGGKGVVANTPVQTMPVADAGQGFGTGANMLLQLEGMKERSDYLKQRGEAQDFLRQYQLSNAAERARQSRVDDARAERALDQTISHQGAMESHQSVMEEFERIRLNKPATDKSFTESMQLMKEMYPRAGKPDSVEELAQLIAMMEAKRLGLKYTPPERERYPPEAIALLEAAAKGEDTTAALNAFWKSKKKTIPTTTADEAGLPSVFGTSLLY